MTGRMLRYEWRTSISTFARGSRTSTSRASFSRSAMCDGEPLVVVVARDEVDDRLFGVARDPVRMDVPLATLCRLGREPVLRDGEDELGCELHRVDELALRRARMHESPRIVTRTEPRRTSPSRARRDPSRRACTRRRRRRPRDRSPRAPRPTSSSTVNATRIGARRRSSVRARYATAAMISAIPALSSAPRSVVPSLVTMSWPTRTARAGSASGSRTCRGSPGSAIASPAHASWTIGDTSAPVTSGVVSTWAISPTTGAPVVAGKRREDGVSLVQLGIDEPDLPQLVDEQP